MTDSVPVREIPEGRRAARLQGLSLLLIVGGVVWGAGVQPGMALLVALTAVVTLGLFLAPKASLAAIGLYLLVQPTLVNVAGGIDSPLGLALQRLHQGFIVAAALRIAFFVWSERVEPRLRRWLWLSLAFLASGLLSALVAGVSAETAALGAFLAIKFQVFLLLALTISWNDEDCRRIVRSALWLGPVLFGTALVLRYLPADIQALFISAGAEDEGFFARGDLSSLQGIMPHPGAFGWAMAVVGCYAVATLLATPRPFGAVSLGTSILGILGSLRRKPLVALPVAVLFAATRFLHGGARWRTLVMMVFVAGGVVGLAAPRVRATYQDVMTGYLDPYAPTAPRTLLYWVGLKIGADRFPLGAGFGRYGGYASRIDYSPVYDQYGLSSVYGLSREYPAYIMDTYWPHILGETGWLGVAILMVFFLMLLARATRAGLESRAPGVRTLAIASSMVLVEALVESLAGPVFEGALFAFVIAVPLGITLAPLDGSPQARRATPEAV